jgi:hypothetical protein
MGVLMMVWGWNGKIHVSQFFLFIFLKSNMRNIIMTLTVTSLSFVCFAGCPGCFPSVKQRSEVESTSENQSPSSPALPVGESDSSFSVGTPSASSSNLVDDGTFTLEFNAIKLILQSHHFLLRSLLRRMMPRGLLFTIQAGPSTIAIFK